MKGTVFIPLINRGVAKVSVEDYLRLRLWSFPWRMTSTGYASYVEGEKRVYLHRLVTDFKFKMVDHKNRDRLDCRQGNLRASSYGKNKANSNPHKGRRFKGVQRSWSRFKAVIVHNKKYFHIGTYSTEEEAARAYNNKALEFFGEHARLNDVD